MRATSPLGVGGDLISPLISGAVQRIRIEPNWYPVTLAEPALSDGARRRGLLGKVHRQGDFPFGRRQHLEMNVRLEEGEMLAGGSAVGDRQQPVEHFTSISRS